MTLEQATAFAPASVGNIGVGFDILGHTIVGPGDRATVRRIETPKVRIAAIRGCAVELPLEAPRNTAGAALIAMIEDLKPPFGFEVELDKGIAYGSGMGGSAASCVAALVAANALLDSPLTRAQLYPYALAGEAVASGGFHGDNVVQFSTKRYCDNPLVVQGPGAGPEVTAAGVFADLLRVAAALGARV